MPPRSKANRPAQRRRPRLGPGRDRRPRPRRRRDQVAGVAGSDRAGADDEDRGRQSRVPEHGLDGRSDEQGPDVVTVGHRPERGVEAARASARRRRRCGGAQTNSEPLKRKPASARHCCTQLLVDERVVAAEADDGALRLAADRRRGRRCRASATSAATPSSSRRPRASMPASTEPSATVSSTARAAASDSASPPWVPEKNTSSNARMTSHAAGDRGDRHAVAERLAVARQVGLDAVPLAGAAGREPEAGDDLVEDRRRRRAARRQVDDALRGSRAAGVVGADGSRTTAATSPSCSSGRRSRSSRSP